MSKFKKFWAVYEDEKGDEFMSERVRLIKTLNNTELPVGIEGFVLDGKLVKHGMNLILWDNGMIIPMYRNEVGKA